MDSTVGCVEATGHVNHHQLTQNPCWLLQPQPREHTRTTNLSYVQNCTGMAGEHWTEAWRTAQMEDWPVAIQESHSSHRGSSFADRQTEFQNCSPK